MADTNTRVMDMVRRELEKDRDVATDDLFQKAVKIDGSVSDLTTRQFHAKYPLQVKRAMKRGGSGKKRSRATKRAKSAKRARGGRTTKKAAKQTRRSRKTAQRKSATTKRASRPRKRTRRATAATAPASGSTSARDAVRRLLLQFGKEIAGADGKADMLDVLTGVDGWVDRVVAASGR